MAYLSTANPHQPTKWNVVQDGLQKIKLQLDSLAEKHKTVGTAAQPTEVLKSASKGMSNLYISTDCFVRSKEG